MIEAVFFDLYETLVTEFDPARRADLAVPSAAAQLGLNEANFAAVWRAHKAARMVRPLDYRDVLRAACAGVSIVPDEAVIARLHAQRLQAKAAPFARLDSAVLAMLRQIKGLGLRLGLISNCAAEEVAAWDASALRPCFDDAVFSYLVGCAKPDAAIYMLACERLGVAPARCLFVGDGGSDELSGAGRAGLTPYWATWFLERSPYWPLAVRERGRAAYPRLRTPRELAAVVIAGAP